MVGIITVILWVGMMDFRWWDIQAVEVGVGVDVGSVFSQPFERRRRRRRRRRSRMKKGKNRFGFGERVSRFVGEN